MCVCVTLCWARGNIGHHAGGAWQLVVGGGASWGTMQLYVLCTNLSTNSCSSTTQNLPQPPPSATRQRSAQRLERRRAQRPGTGVRISRYARILDPTEVTVCTESITWFSWVSSVVTTESWSKSCSIPASTRTSSHTHTYTLTHTHTRSHTRPNTHTHVPVAKSFLDGNISASQYNNFLICSEWLDVNKHIQFRKATEENSKFWTGEIKITSGLLLGSRDRDTRRSREKVIVLFTHQWKLGASFTGKLCLSVCHGPCYSRESLGFVTCRGKEAPTS